MSKNHKIASMFSISLLREDPTLFSAPGGYLSLGGLPPVDIHPHFAKTPILLTGVANGHKTFYDYSINIDTMVVNGTRIPHSGGSGIRYVVSMLHRS
jgi:hypothetical protein